MTTDIVKWLEMIRVRTHIFCRITTEVPLGQEAGHPPPRHTFPVQQVKQHHGKTTVALHARSNRHAVFSTGTKAHL